MWMKCIKSFYAYLTRDFEMARMDNICVSMGMGDNITCAKYRQL